MMTLAAKGVPYAFHEANLASDTLLELHPFGRIPVLTQGSVRIFETLAICSYVDRRLPGPPLQPVDPVASAEMLQWVSATQDYIYGTMVRQCILERFLKPMRGYDPDEALIAAAKPQIQRHLTILDCALSDRAFLAGPDMSLADFFLTPIIVYFAATPEGQKLLPEAPSLVSWLRRMESAPRFAEINDLP